MDLLIKRENELTKITQVAGRGFFCFYGLAFMANCFFRKGSMPYFKDIVTHTILMLGGSFVSGRLAEKVAAEFVYNRVLIQLADKYNFSPEEVLDLQRNLN